jgi:hypothetical protein
MEIIDRALQRDRESRFGFMISFQTVESDMGALVENIILHMGTKHLNPSLECCYTT